MAGAMLRDEKAEITPKDMEHLTNKTSYDNLNLTRFTKEGSNQNNTFLTRMVYKFADLVAFITVEGAMLSLNFGYNNPQYNFNLAWKLMFVSCFAVLIIPIIYILLFIGYGIYNIVIWIKKWRSIKNVQSKEKNKT
jgi:hypothetical protein